MPVIGPAIELGAVGDPVADPVLEREHQPRLADPGLAGDHDRPLRARFDLAPAVAQQLDLTLPFHERRGVALRAGLEPAGGADRPAGPIHLDRVGDALQPDRAAVLELEQPLDQPLRGGADQHLARAGGVLQPRGDVRGLADQAQVVAPRYRAQIADHHQPAVNADVETQLFPVRRQARMLEPGDRLDHLETGPDRARRIVVMRGRIAEAHQHRIAQEPHHLALVARDDVDAGLVEMMQDVAQILRVQPVGERGRSDQIGEADGQEAAFGGQQPGLADRLPAAAAIGLLRPVLERARGAAHRQPPAAGGAKAPALPIVGAAPGAAHAGFPAAARL